MNLKLPLFWLALCMCLKGQQSGSISGIVLDRSGDSVAAANVRVQSQDTGARQSLTSDSAGRYATTSLAPGSYKVTVRRDGFRTTTQQDINVSAGKVTCVDFVIEVLPLQQEVTVSAPQTDLDPTASGLTMSRTAPSAGLPQNGHDVHAFFTIMPGATVAPSSVSAGGQFTVSGQRPNANSFWVDGVRANLGLGLPTLPGVIAGGSLPGMSATGGLQSLASKEETERVDLRSADFAAEFGDRPGAEIRLETRGGTADFHGSIFGYLRPRVLNSQDWFARGAGTPLPSAFLNGFGASLGGPLTRKRTFFFVSFEKAGVRDGALQLISVPTLATRVQPSLATYQFLFNAFPQPQGRLLNAQYALSNSRLQTDATVTNRALRVDHTLREHIQLFARYSDVPSSLLTSGLNAGSSAFQWSSATVGVNFTHGTMLHEFRLNYSHALANSDPVSPYTPGLGIIDDPTQYLFLSGFLTRLSMEGVGQTISAAPAETRENQYSGLYNLTWHKGRHEWRAGFNYTRVLESGPVNSYGATLSIVSPGINELLAGIPLGVTATYAGDQNVSPRYSSFVQDSIHVSDRLLVEIGIRWDVTPPLQYGATFAPSFFFAGYWKGAGSIPVQIDTNNYGSAYANWPLHYDQIAPRLGFAYRLGSPNLVLRAGGGLFYDPGLASVIGNTDPIDVWRYLPNTVSPLVSSSANFPGQNVTLALPRVWEWKVSLEKSFKQQSLLSLSYFGSSGSKLLRNEAALDPLNSVLETVSFTSRGTSNYNALLANFHANLSSNLFTTVSYTFGHSFDTASSDTTPILSTGPSNKGSSSFDVRNALTASLAYRTPNRLGRLFGGWTLSSNTLARTGFPFDVTTVDRSIGLGFDNSDRASLVPGQPIWIYGSGFPGGRALNPAAFQSPAAGEQGTLGRNALTGAGLFQIDTSLRRQIRLYRGGSVEAIVSAFNLLNHPSFANPVNYLGSALFGQSTSMTSLMLGSGSPTTGLTPLFQAGGPRTIELSLRFSF